MHVQKYFSRFSKIRFTESFKSNGINAFARTRNLKTDRRSFLDLYDRKAETFVTRFTSVHFKIFLPKLKRWFFRQMLHLCASTFWSPILNFQILHIFFLTIILKINLIFNFRNGASTSTILNVSTVTIPSKCLVEYFLRIKF